MDDLGTALSECLTECLDREMPLPFLMVVVGVNGCIIGARYTHSEDEDERLDAEVLFKHPTDGKMVLPINIMIVDASGEAARVLISAEEIVFH